MTNSDNAEKQSPLACDVNAIEPDRREQHIITGKKVLQAVTDIRELPEVMPSSCLMIRKPEDRDLERSYA